MQYTLSRELFDELVNKLGKDGAEKFANAIELFLDIVHKESQKEIVQKKEEVKAELYNELRNELATKEFVRAEINGVRGEIQKNNLLLKVLIAISLFAMTLFNPTFVKLIEKIFS